MPAFLAAMPGSSVLSQQLMLGLIAGSGLACLLAFAWGLWRRMRQPLANDADFPQPADQCLALGYVLVMLAVGASGLLKAPSSGGGAPMTVERVLTSLLWQLGLYLPLLVRYGLLPSWPRPQLRVWQYVFWPLFLLGVSYVAVELPGVFGFYDWLVEVTQCPEQQAVVTQFQQGGADALLRVSVAISAVVIAPLTEECCFRGFLYSSLRRGCGRAGAVLVSAAVFAAVHASLAQFLPLFLFGAILALAYEKARSLWLPVAVHALFNAMTLLTLL